MTPSRTDTQDPLVPPQSNRNSPQDSQTYQARISELEKIVKDIQRERNDFKNVFEHAPMMIWFKDDQNTILRANQSAARSLQMTPEQMQGKSTWDLYPDEADAYYADDQEVIASGKPKLGIIEKYETSTGKIWIQTDKVPWKDEHGKVKGVVVFVEDISKKMEAQEILQNREEQLRKYNQILMRWAVSRSALEGNLTSALNEISELSANTLALNRVSIWFFNDEHSEIHCVDLYDRLENKHSEGIDLLATEYPLYFQAIKDNRTIAAHDAHTDPRTKEISESYLKPLGINSMLDAPIRAHGETIGIICHEHVGPARSWTPEEENFAGSMADFIALSFEGYERKQAEEALKNAHDELEKRVEERTTELSKSNQQLEREIMERKNTEEKLRQIQKMDAIGTLAGGIAHDFNNMLSAILGNTDLLKIYEKNNPESHDSVLAIERVALRASTLTKQILSFSRQGNHQTQSLDIHEVIKEVIKLMNRTIDKNIHMETHLDAKTHHISGDADQIQQLLVNVLINARDVMPQGGSITIQTRNEFKENRDFLETLQMKSGEYIILSIQDTGVGISKDIRGRIFEPFFTTKGPGEGTGMGLAIAYGIVKSHRGHIDFETKYNEGTTFHIYLPLKKQESEVQKVPKVPALLKGSGLVLLVDDEEDLRRTTYKMLEQLGYQVMSAENSEEAVDIYQKNKDQIQLVVIDLVMPKTGGLDCFRELKKIDPQVKALLTTGYEMDSVAQIAFDEGMLGLLPKPFQIHRLSEAIAMALAAKVPRMH